MDRVCTRAIQATDDFKKPFSVPLRDADNFILDTTSVDENEEQAKARAIESFYRGDLYLGVSAHQGYISAEAITTKRPELAGSGFTQYIDPWRFRIQLKLTDKGKQVVSAVGAGSESDKIVPLARKEVTEVTGISKGPMENQATAEFTWKSIPTKVGEAFDPSTEAFKRLLSQLQKELKKEKGFGLLSRDSTQDWDEQNKGRAVFQLYDDGWRLVLIR